MKDTQDQDQDQASGAGALTSARVTALAGFGSTQPHGTFNGHDSEMLSDSVVA